VERWEDEKEMETILSLPPNNLIQDSKGNEENRNSVLDSNKTNINNAKEHKDAHENSLKEEILQVITENFMEMLLDIDRVIMSPFC
jgi:hypothetical protein